jgi:hypothetical protein
VRLNDFDDYPFHQAFTPLDVPATSDSHYNDGYWFSFYGAAQYFYFGLRLHPNNNVMDGYAGVVQNGEQRTLRVSRALRPRTNELEIGPHRLQILEPMRRQRLTLAENETGISYDVEIERVMRPFLEAQHVQYRFGRMINNLSRYVGVNRATGTATIDGETIEIDRWHSARDHSWGIRSTMGPFVPLHGIEPEQGDGDPRALRLWVPFEVDGHSGFFHMHEDADGNVLDFEGRLVEADGRELTLASARHHETYHEGTVMGRAGGGLRAGEFTLIGHDGSERAYSYEVVGGGVSVEGFGYHRGWEDGGSPGVYRGALVTQPNSYRIDDHTVVPGPDSVPPEKRLGLTEYAATLTGPGGAGGMAMVEHMIYGTYRPYGIGV